MRGSPAGSSVGLQWALLWGASVTTSVGLDGASVITRLVLRQPSVGASVAGALVASSGLEHRRPAAGCTTNRESKINKLRFIFNDILLLENKKWD
jgi:hypothetical protein